jgi:Glycosyl transferase WecG/TagA/CpsF family/NAD dependent epimerase/dehydratase family
MSVKKRVLLTSGAGFLGSHLCARLLNQECEVPCVDSYKRQHRLAIRVARIFNTYRPNVHPQDGRVVSSSIQAFNNKSITIYGSGSQTRSFCYVDDLVEGLTRLMNVEGDVEGPRQSLRSYHPRSWRVSLSPRRLALEARRGASGDRVGAAFDFLAGARRRAPLWMQRNGLEWLFRLCSEPRRPWRRYAYIVPGFAILAAGELLRRAIRTFEDAPSGSPSRK